MKSAHSALYFSLILTAALLIQACSPIPAQSTQPALADLPASGPGSPDSILSATLQILAFLAEQPETSNQVVYERGLASLIQPGSEIYLVTHDHWNSLSEIARVQFLDVDSKLLAEISGEEFRGLIRYQDQGSMLLAAPAELHPSYLTLLAARAGEKENRPVVPATLADPQVLQAGQIVTIAYRVGEDRSQVGTKQAAVIEVAEVEGLPAIRLQSLDGSVILPGDSGGGIWLDGKLVGNMWMSVRVPQKGILNWGPTDSSPHYLDTSIAAQLPAVIPASLSQTQPSLVEDDLLETARLDR